MKNVAVKYFEMDVARDPTEERTKWILTQLRQRPQTSEDLVRKAGLNNLGYAKATYSRDLMGLVKRNLVNRPYERGGEYTINNPYAFAWMSARGMLD
jgi:hypothetical protein